MNNENKEGNVGQKAGQKEVSCESIFDDPPDSREYSQFYFWDREVPENPPPIPPEEIIYEGYLLNRKSGKDEALIKKFYVLTKEKLAGYAVCMVSEMIMTSIG
jgi:hypothetical protein